jgi:hypothetical protein
MPCFAVVPTERMPFADLCRTIAGLIESESLASGVPLNGSGRRDFTSSTPSQLLPSKLPVPFVWFFDSIFFLTRRFCNGDNAQEASFEQPSRDV